MTFLLGQHVPIFLALLERSVFFHFSQLINQKHLMSAATPLMLAALRKKLTKDQGGLDLEDPLLYPSNHGYFLFF